MRDGASILHEQIERVQIRFIDLLVIHKVIFIRMHRGDIGIVGFFVMNVDRQANLLLLLRLNGLFVLFVE